VFNLRKTDMLSTISNNNDTASPALSAILILPGDDRIEGGGGKVVSHNVLSGRIGGVLSGIRVLLELGGLAQGVRLMGQPVSRPDPPGHHTDRESRL
jgi:hypothetical protein